MKNGIIHQSQHAPDPAYPTDAREKSTMADTTAYHIAERKIEKALRAREIELDLRGSDDTGLTELPESLGQLTQLESLDLSGNQLTALPESLIRLTQLEWLNLSENQLTTLPESLSQLTQLQSLRFSGNQLAALPEWLSQLTWLRSLGLSGNQLTTLPESLGQLTQLEYLELSGNRLMALPESLSRLTQLRYLNLSGNRLTTLPASLIRLTRLERLSLSGNQLTMLPESLIRLTRLQLLRLSGNRLTTLPASLGRLDSLGTLEVESNPFHPELAAAVSEGLNAVRRYLRAQARAQVALNEAKLILIGEGEVGKSCLLGALRGDPWEEGRPTTHGIEIKPVEVTDPGTGIEIRLNGWDFGGQRVYRPTHQLFFTAPAVYLVVWKPREGPQQGFVKEWIKLVKHREPEAKILVVSTHGGPQARQPDIDRQEIWDLNPGAQGNRGAEAGDRPRCGRPAGDGPPLPQALASGARAVARDRGCLSAARSVLRHLRGTGHRAGGRPAPAAHLSPGRGPDPLRA